ncbi:MAG: 3-keto-5-aminohexanoate cleavage protein [Pseudomonadota bacterium]
MNKLIITAAITGAETTKEMNPNLPVTAEEQAKEARECVKAGAAIIHLHVRDSKGNPSQKIADFKRSIEAINDSCDPRPITQISTGGAVGASIEDRIKPIVKLKPEFASLNIASMNFGEDVFINHPKDVKKLATTLKDLNVAYEVEVYDAGHIESAKRLAKKGVIRTPIHYQFVLGVHGGMSGDLRNLNFLIDSIDEGDTWSVAGIGRYEYPLAVEAVKRGGFVRVGFEDNIYYEKGVLAKSNSQLVERISRLANELKREIATPDEARKMLNLKSRM